MTVTRTRGSVADRVVMVTGGGGGIGAAIAERFVEDGATVVLVGRRREPLESVAEQTGAHVIVADAADSASARAAVEETVDRFGRLDILVAGAGGSSFNKVGDMPDEEWDASFRGNVTTAFVTAREALPALMAHGDGAIVILSSLSGHFAAPSVAGYVVGKHALIGLTRSLARDYSKVGVRVNAVCPGWVRTGMADAEMDEVAAHAPEGTTRDDAYALATSEVPMKRPAEADEVAAAVRFLASSDASYITGTSLIVDGGAHIVDLGTLVFDHVGI